jgi:hypothetical protein
VKARRAVKRAARAHQPFARRRAGVTGLFWTAALTASMATLRALACLRLRAFFLAFERRAAIVLLLLVLPSKCQ